MSKPFDLLRDYRDQVRVNEKLREQLDAAKEALAVAAPIVTEAFWDHHTAGTLPGSGYTHRVYRHVSSAFGWRTSDKFKEWEKKTSDVLKSQV